MKEAPLNWTLMLSVIGAIFLIWVLREKADPEVQVSLGWQLLYLGLGLYLWVYKIWMTVFAGATGVMLKQDAIERANPAADVFLGCVALANIVCYASSNIGSGPGPQVVVLCSLLANGALAICALILNLIFGFSDRITIEQSRQAAVMYGLILLILSVVFGYFAAGDWT